MRVLSTLALMLLGTAPVWAEHADIDLRLQALDPRTGQVRAEAHAVADHEPPLGGLLPRPLLTVRVEEPLMLQFILTSTYPHGEQKNVTVRYYVVREAAPRQKELPYLENGFITGGSFQLNLKQHGRVGARIRFSLPEPGFYLLRVDTQNTQGDHEHFSAIDLKVEK